MSCGTIQQAIQTTQNFVLKTRHGFEESEVYVRVAAIFEGIVILKHQFQACKLYNGASLLIHYVITIERHFPDPATLRGITIGTDGLANFSANVGWFLSTLGNAASRIPFSLFGLVSFLVAPLALFSTVRSGYHLLVRELWADKFEALLELITNCGVALRIGGTLAMSIETLLYTAPLVASCAPPIALAGGLLSAFTTFIHVFGWFRTHRMLKGVLKRIEKEENEPFLKEFMGMNHWKLKSCLGLSDSKRFKEIYKNVAVEFEKDRDPQRIERLQLCLKKRLITKKAMDLVGIATGITHIVAVVVFFTTATTPAYPVAYIAIAVSFTVSFLQCCVNIYLTHRFWSEMKKIDPCYKPQVNWINKTFRWIKGKAGYLPVSAQQATVSAA